MHAGKVFHERAIYNTFKYYFCVNPSRLNPGRREKMNFILFSPFFVVPHKTFCGNTKKCENKNSS